MRSTTSLLAAVVAAGSLFGACSDDSTTAPAASTTAADDSASLSGAEAVLAEMIADACVNTGGKLDLSTDLFEVKPSGAPEEVGVLMTIFFDEYRDAYDAAADVSILDVGLCDSTPAELIGVIQPTIDTFRECAAEWPDLDSAKFYCLES
ncbi:MAG: hypothetical protein Q7V88_07410 [Actinomycetota bacterium]|nr:hypothetical protein [Actinomycetota bacterium]